MHVHTEYPTITGTLSRLDLCTIFTTQQPRSYATRMAWQRPRLRLHVIPYHTRTTKCITQHEPTTPDAFSFFSLGVLVLRDRFMPHVLVFRERLRSPLLLYSFVGMLRNHAAATAVYAQELDYRQLHLPFCWESIYLTAPNSRGPCRRKRKSRLLGGGGGGLRCDTAGPRCGIYNVPAAACTNTPFACSM